MAVFGEYELLARSGLFDSDYYLKSNPDLSDLNIDPLVHYLERGCHERREPSEKFDTSHYLSQCAAVGEAPPNALIHYLTVGVRRGFTPRRIEGASAQSAVAAVATRKDRTAARSSSDANGHNTVVAVASANAKSASVKRSDTIELAGMAQRDALAATEAVNALLPANGYIDFFGYSTAAGGWLFCGWISRPYRTDEVGEIEFLAQYEQSQDRGKAILTFYQRSDLDQRSVGIIAFLPASSRIQGGLQHVSFQIGAVKYKAQNSATTARLLDQDLVDRLRPLLLHHALANPNRSYLLSITARRGFTGQDTLSALAEPVLLEIDEATFCPPTGVLLRGWCLVGAGIVRSIRVRSGPLSGELKLDDAIRIDRPDVITAVGQSLGFTDARCGFIAYAEGAISPGDITYVEIELTNGEIGFKNFKLTKRSGLDAMRRILEGVDVRYAELDGAFDHVLGPAITALNRARLQSAPVPAQIDYGSIPDQPRCTLIIPLYGRVDFVEYQLALFSQHPGMREVEILYVLDDPGKRRELEFLAQSTFERFRVPFRLLLLPANLGFAPANNVGLRAAHGEFVCFLNSDIFPITPDWLEQLMQRLEEHDDLGVVGAQLLFEDGSIQHDGCYYRPIAELGGWQFVEHHDKGRRPGADSSLRRCDVITGACMLMRRKLAEDLGGFDESFIVGDFEDADLCLKVKQRGLTCAVDRAARLYHLERKSQTAPSHNWRMNMTLYNAWVHQRRWFSKEAS